MRVYLMKRVKRVMAAARMAEITVDKRCTPSHVLVQPLDFG